MCFSLSIFAPALLLVAIALAQTFATTRNEEIDPNQELVAFGVASIFGFFNQCFPISGSFSRTALNNEMHARTQASDIFCALLMILALLVLTEIFQYLPNAILAYSICIILAMLVSTAMLVYRSISPKIATMEQLVGGTTTAWVD